MSKKRFSTFEGVFTPTLLSILGIIMYLRLGWVVGESGLGGALLIILIANFITLMTSLSMSSIVTNIKIGGGGAYSIIAKSLGVEAGAAIGVPLYLSQAISIAFYITGFTECWIAIFPAHQAIFVSLTTWFFLLAISYFSAKLAFRLQFGIMAIIFLSLVSFTLGNHTPQHQIIIFEKGNIENFWKVFAIFFPAVTGVLAGASMSGELKDARSSIPKGTLSAVIVSFFIYTFVAVLFAVKAPADMLRSQTSIMLDISRWRWMVIAGLMGATLSSALSMMVASPRTLHAMASHRMTPFHDALIRENKRGEPVIAILFTAMLAFLTIIFSNLNKIAALLTMFFLITYMTINLSVFIEQSIGLVSFRPTFRISKIFPLAGFLGCIWVMVHVNPEFTLVALLIIAVFYVIFARIEIKAFFPDIRCGLLTFIAERAANAASNLPYHPKIWKPNLLIPVIDQQDYKGLTSFIRSIVFPNGRILIFGISDPDNKNIKEHKKNFQDRLSAIVDPIKNDGILTAKILTESHDFCAGATVMIQSLKSMFFPPNILLCSLGQEDKHDSKEYCVLERAMEEGLGIILIKYHADACFGSEKVINLWIREKSPNVDLSVLIALQLQRNWDGKLRLIQVVDNREDVPAAQSYLARIQKLTRLSCDVEISPMVGSFWKALSEAPPADINIFGAAEHFDFPWIRKVSQTTASSVVVLRDSKHESAFA